MMSKPITSEKKMSRACSFRYLSIHQVAVPSLSDYTLQLGRNKNNTISLFCRIITKVVQMNQILPMENTHSEAAELLNQI